MSHYKDDFYGSHQDYSTDNIPLTVRNSWGNHDNYLGSSDAPPLPPKDVPQLTLEGTEPYEGVRERSSGMILGNDYDDNGELLRSESRERFLTTHYGGDYYQRYNDGRQQSLYYDHDLPPLPTEAEEPLNAGDRQLRKKSSYAQRMRRNSLWRQKPWFVWFISLAQVIVFTVELIKMGIWTGSPIETKPSFNPMIGPSAYVMINMGARFTPCMHYISGLSNDYSLQYPCPNSTTVDTNVCSLSELCGMGGIYEPSTQKNPPNQWWRFFTPIFIHAGFIHIGFNLLLQLRLGAELEKEIGIIRFVLVYFTSGVAGFVLGGNFSPDGITSTGASGSIFGVIALDLLDLLFNWQLYATPVKNLLLHILEIIVSFVLGMLPGIDNFSHIGGLAMGVLTGTALLRSPLKIRLKVAGPQIPENGAKLQVLQFDWRDPKEHFRNRSRWWYGWILVRLGAVALALVYLVVLIKQFENGGGHCSWCKYLSCLPVHNWCDTGNITPTSSSS